jgi:hypothetical protein
VRERYILRFVWRTQEKLDFVVPVATVDMGILGIAVSVGVVCDGAACMPAEHFYTRGDGVFWPVETYADFRPLPQSWMGFVSLAVAQQPQLHSAGTPFIAGK